MIIAYGETKTGNSWLLHFNKLVPKFDEYRSTKDLRQNGQPFITEWAMTLGIHNLLIPDIGMTRFGCAVINEAHERSQNTNSILASLKETVHRRPGMKMWPFY